MNELALFAGAGGGILGGKLLGWRTVCAVEIDRHRRDCLLALPGDGSLEPFPIWDDVRTFDGMPWRGRVDVVSGGFPCQAYSTAARGRNTADDLWPEMRRVIAEAAPRYVFAENVSREAIDAAADDCEAMGYRARCISLGASDLGADHVRQRYWLRAYADDQGELCRGVNAEVASLQSLCAGVWSAEPWSRGMDDGMAGRMERYAATGNGQVPIVAAAAWWLLRATVTENEHLS